MYTTDAAATEHFFTFNIGAAKGADPENANGQRYYINNRQFIEILPLPPGRAATLLDHVSFVTSDVSGLRNYFLANNAAPGEIQTNSDGSRWFKINDPEENVVEFIQYSAQLPSLPAFTPVGRHILHVGYVVNSYEAEDLFYKGLLGFRPYWYGNAKPGAISWMSATVPDGDDLMEYIMPTGFPGTPQSARSIGASNHVGIGVVNIPETGAVLKAADRMGKNANGPKIAFDGKWQINLFDPDGNRVELMEYSNVQPPCCSAFSAPHPKPPAE
jgi:catechol 2,3-dioxygenase-like lactoylglutathione lyase family enzyme